jgi:hypothetical protein
MIFFLIILAIIIAIVVIVTVKSKLSFINERKYYKSGDSIRIGYEQPFDATLIRWDKTHFGYILNNETDITFKKWSDFGMNYTYHEELIRKKHEEKMKSTEEFMKENDVYIKPLNRIEKIDRINGVI